MSQRRSTRSMGTITIPPPTPKRALKKPATSPIRTRRTGLCYERGRDVRRAARARDCGAGGGRDLPRLRRGARTGRRPPGRRVPAGGDAGRARPPRRPLPARRGRQRPGGQRRPRTDRDRRDRVRRLARARARPPGGPVAPADRGLRGSGGVGACGNGAQGAVGRLSLPSPRGRAGCRPRARGDRRARARRRPRRALRTQGARGPPARRLEQGNRGPSSARRRRPRPRARRGRRRHRPRRVSRRRGARAQAPRRRSRGRVALAPRRARRARSRVDGGVPRAPTPSLVHVGEAALAPVRARLGTPLALEWQGEISDAEWAIATHNPARTHDVTLFILDLSRRVALIRKPHFKAGVWRPPGGGIKPGEDFVAGAVREALEETGLHVELRRYLVASSAIFTNSGRELHWRTHVVL